MKYTELVASAELYEILIFSCAAAFAAAISTNSTDAVTIRFGI
jgi:hypothetical protein